MALVKPLHRAFERLYLVAIRDLTCAATAPPKSQWGIVAECDSVACRVRMEIRPNACRYLRIAHHVRVTTM
jgi:hypothetical protein